jgi:hypothetical protein
MTESEKRYWWSLAGGFLALGFVVTVVGNVLHVFDNWPRWLELILIGALALLIWEFGKWMERRAEAAAEKNKEPAP